MRIEYHKSRGEMVSLVMAGVIVAVGVLLVRQLVAIGGLSREGTASLLKEIESSQAEAGKEALTAQKELATALKKKNLFVPKPPKPSAPKFTGILGAEAYSGSKWYKVGDMVGGAKVLAITATTVKIEWEGKEKTLALVHAGSPSGGSDGATVKRTGPGKTRMQRGDFKSKQIKPAKAPAEKSSGGGDDLDWLNVPDSVKEKFRKMWNNLSDEQKQESRERWEQMSEEEQQEAIEQM